MTSLEEASARFDRAYAEVIAAAENLRSVVLATTGTTGDPALAILYSVSRHFRVAAPEILGAGRGNQVVTARQVAMVITRRLTQRSRSSIAKEYGGRTRATVVWAEHTIDARCATEPVFKKQFDALLAACATLTRKEDAA
jgi:chromosomal replication initiator protein